MLVDFIAVCVKLGHRRQVSFHNLAAFLGRIFLKFFQLPGDREDLVAHGHQVKEVRVARA